MPIHKKGHGRHPKAGGHDGSGAKEPANDCIHCRDPHVTSALHANLAKRALIHRSQRFRASWRHYPFRRPMHGWIGCCRAKCYLQVDGLHLFDSCSIHMSVYYPGGRLWPIYRCPRGSALMHTLSYRAWLKRTLQQGFPLANLPSKRRSTS
jgi:hypothetical protein